MSALVVYLLFLVAAICAIGLLMILWIKLSTRGKVVTVFFEGRKIYSMLLPEDVNNQCVWRGAPDDPNREKYRLVPEKVFEIRYPSGVPWFMQERLRAWMFTRNNDEPWDPHNAKVVMSAKMNRMISDEALLRTMWRDVRQATQGAQAAAGSSLRTILLFGLVILIVAINLLLTYNLGKQLSAETEMLKQILHLLGGS